MQTGLTTIRRWIIGYSQQCTIVTHLLADTCSFITAALMIDNNSFSYLPLLLVDKLILVDAHKVQVGF